MDKDSKFTRDEDGYVAVRTVSAPYSSGSDDKDSMFTRDEDGYVAVRTISGSGGGSGGDQHNLGWYATESALTTAHPTAEAGDWAIVGATDTVWVWDTDNTEWVDSDQKGQVTSVNNQTGAVTITADDILPSQTGNSGKFLTTDGTDASWGNAVPLDSNGNVLIRNLPNSTLSISSQYGNLPFVDFRVGNNVVGNITLGYGNFSLQTNQYGITAILGVNMNGIYGYTSSGGDFDLGVSNRIFNRTYTTKINNGADITVPNTTGTMVVADSTGASAGQVLTLDSNLAPVWANASGGGSTGTTASLVVANWSSNTQTVNVTGVTASNNVIVAPAPASQADYTAAGIICTAQANGTLTFSCTTVPSSAITVNVLII